MKTLNSLTIKEFFLYSDIVSDKEYDPLELLELFNGPSEDLSYEQMQKGLRTIFNYTLDKKKIKRVIKIGGRFFRIDLNLTKIKASQFIDFQMYMKDFKIENVLSVFMIPQRMTFWGLRDEKDYSLKEVQSYIFNNMLYVDALAISNFFLLQSTNLYKITHKRFLKKVMEEKKKENQRLAKDLIPTPGSLLSRILQKFQN